MACTLGDPHHDICSPVSAVTRGAATWPRFVDPAAGAGCIVVLTLEAFCDASLFTSTAVLVYTTATLGLALAQRISRTAQ